MSCSCPECLAGSSNQTYFMPAPPIGTQPYTYAQPSFACPSMSYLPEMQCQDSCCAPQFSGRGMTCGLPAMTYMSFAGMGVGCGDPCCPFPGCGVFGGGVGGGRPQIDINMDIGGGTTGGVCNDPFCPERDCGGGFAMPYSSTSSYRRRVKTSSLPKFGFGNLGSSSGWKNISLGGGKSKVRWEKQTGGTYDSYGSGRGMM